MSDRDRLAALGLFSVVPGPPGPAGSRGARGKRGHDGAPGPAGLPGVDGLGDGEWSLIWGHDSVSGTTTFRWLAPGHRQGLAPAGNFFNVAYPFDLEVMSMRAAHRSPSGNGNNVDYGLQLNGAAPAVIVSVASDSNVPIDSPAAPFPLLIAAGTRIDIRAGKAASIGGAGNLYPYVLLTVRKA